MFEITNQTTQPQELSHNRQLAPGETKPVKEIGKRERALEARGVVFIKDIDQAPVAANGGRTRAAKQATITAPDGGQPSGK
ncbi:MAG: hypothetical protein M3209_00260 [Acidobacteriota bacterium]|nr:hypothetical protein [Acidobacteriota bacterium]